MRLTAALLVLALVFSGTVNAMPERFFRPGDPLNANDINNIVDALLHQITGGKGIQVRTFGDRLIVSKDARRQAKTPLADPMWDVVFDRPSFLPTWLVELGGYLYCGEDGGEVWRSANGDLDSWVQCADAVPTFCYAAAAFDGYLYVGGVSFGDSIIVRTTDGTSWTEVFRDVYQVEPPPYKVDIPYAMAAHDGNLYAFTSEYWYGGTSHVYKTSNGTSWTNMGDWLPAGVAGVNTRSAVSDGTYIYALQNQYLRRSTDGSSWATVLNVSATGGWFPRLDYRGGVLLAGQRGPYTSADGSSWEQTNIGPATTLKMIVSMGVNRWRRVSTGIPFSCPAGGGDGSADLYTDAFLAKSGVGQYANMAVYNGYCYCGLYSGGIGRIEDR